MSTSIYEIDVLQVEDIVRNVDFPAMQSGPLYRIMFPPAAEMTEGLGDAMTFETDSFLQICAPDGISLRFCSWTIGPSRPKEINSSTKSNCSNVSRDLKKEQDRVLQNFNAFCRLIFMFVRLDFQRQGFGSQFLKAVCSQIDEYRLPAFVMASPDRIGLYKKFGFDVVRKIEMRTGTIASIVRPAAST
ncbi:hypothetical protein F5Y16DRAFT_411222 [Xylariaceae sp. FL0255]|nr:hypothetical protein F5Y16DRAFT_411222 [Xylariaceae sp. FL0255]